MAVEVLSALARGATPEKLLNKTAAPNKKSVAQKRIRRRGEDAMEVTPIKLLGGL